jgi:hypothetical protein
MTLILFYRDNVYFFTLVIRMFVAINVPEHTIFTPQTRKEVSKVEFHRLDNIPKSSYHVIPFIPKIKRWISRYQQQYQQSRDKSTSNNRKSTSRIRTGKTGLDDSNYSSLASSGVVFSKRAGPQPPPLTAAESILAILRRAAPLTTSKTLSTTSTVSHPKQFSLSSSSKAHANLGVNAAAVNTNTTAMKSIKSRVPVGRSQSRNKNSLSAIFDGRSAETFADDPTAGLIDE